jgi:hypothetical protein
MIWRVWVQGSLCHLVANTCRLEEALESNIMPARGLVFVSAMILRPWDFLLATESVASNYHTLYCRSHLAA